MINTSTELRKKSLMVKHTLVYVALEDRCLLKICKPLYFATLSSLKKEGWVKTECWVLFIYVLPAWVLTLELTSALPSRLF